MFCCASCVYAISSSITLTAPEVKKHRRIFTLMAERDREAALRLGRAIQVRRAELGLKRRQLHEAAGISYPYLSEIENGSKEPSPQRLRAIAEALQTTPEELLARGAELSLASEDALPGAVVPAVSHAPERSYFALTQANGPSEPSASLSPDPSSGEVADAVQDAIVWWSTNELPRLVRQEVDRYL